MRVSQQKRKKQLLLLNKENKQLCIDLEHEKKSNKRALDLLSSHKEDSCEVIAKDNLSQLSLLKKQN